MTVGIVGMGYVGLSVAVAFADAGVTAIGADVDAERVDAQRAVTRGLNSANVERL
jgi:UDP-N-acetyl-D-mannosaminuronate dehydrogenase